MDNIERENQDVKEIANTVKKDINSSYYEDDQDYYSDYSNSSGSGSSSSTSASTAGATNGAASATAESAGEAKTASADEPVSGNGVPVEANNTSDSPTAKAS
jgi:hypothetical protein